jgi:hypothetical protein
MAVQGCKGDKVRWFAGVGSGVRKMANVDEAEKEQRQTHHVAWHSGYSSIQVTIECTTQSTIVHQASAAQAEYHARYI